MSMVVFDLIDQSGTESGYGIFVLEDGNRVVGRYSGTLAAVAGRTVRVITVCAARSS